MGRLTEKQRDILVGNLLGDGYIHLSPHKTASFEIRQKETHKDYIFWLWNELKELCSIEPQQRIDNRQWRLRTDYLVEFAELHHIFYGSGIKTIPVKIDVLLKNPLSLAIWYMDDGTLDWRLHDHYAFRIATNCFSLDDHRLLQKVLKKNFNVDATWQKSTMRGKLYYRLHIGAYGRDRFFSLVRPYIIPSFQYKLPQLKF